MVAVAVVVVTQTNTNIEGVAKWNIYFRQRLNSKNHTTSRVASSMAELAPPTEMSAAAAPVEEVLEGTPIGRASETPLASEGRQQEEPGTGSTAPASTPSERAADVKNPGQLGSPGLVTSQRRSAASTAGRLKARHIRGDPYVEQEAIAEEFAGKRTFVQAMADHGATCAEELPWNYWLREAQSIARVYPDAPKGNQLKSLSA